jgi:hypothetical protein
VAGSLLAAGFVAVSLGSGAWLLLDCAGLAASCGFFGGMGLASAAHANKTSAASEMYAVRTQARYHKII